MKKRICLYLIFMILSQAFCHEAKKQTERVEAEELTTRWEACKKAQGTEKYNSYFDDFYKALKSAKPESTMVYYFPEAEEIYGRLVKAAEIRSIPQMDEAIRDWEILQKSFIRFELQQLSSSYRLVTSVIFVSTILMVVFFLLFLLTSRNRSEDKAFTRQMLRTQETERERISNELHDTVCQDLRVLQFQLDKPESVELCKKIAGDVRNTCYTLTPSDLNEGILEAIVSLCALCRKQNGVNIILSIQEDVKESPAFKDFSKEKNLNIYRIVQEVLTNAVKHAKAENISVLIRSFDQANFRIIISDDGDGFDLKTAFKKKNHFGLKNIKTRTENIEGAITFNSAPGEGTQITLSVPYGSKTE